MQYSTDLIINDLSYEGNFIYNEKATIFRTI